MTDPSAASSPPLLLLLLLLLQTTRFLLSRSATAMAWRREGNKAAIDSTPPKDSEVPLRPDGTFRHLSPEFVMLSEPGRAVSKLWWCFDVLLSFALASSSSSCARSRRLRARGSGSGAAGGAWRAWLTLPAAPPSSLPLPLHHYHWSLTVAGWLDGRVISLFARFLRLRHGNAALDAWSCGAFARFSGRLAGCQTHSLPTPAKPLRRV
ncbi:hypothetical protein BKA80DRAFT_281779 [Phyllosticta citrichinensis]